MAWSSRPHAIRPLQLQRILPVSPSPLELSLRSLPRLQQQFYEDSFRPWGFHLRHPMNKGPPSRKTTGLCSTTSSVYEASEDEIDRLPLSVLPILWTVLALIISEGIALSTLPLHLQSLGANPVQVGLSTSAFSVAQMVMCPLIVGASSRLGRKPALRLCLTGAAASSLVIAGATTLPLLVAARFLAGVFAAGIPVAQAGVVDLVPPQLQTLALSRVSAASQTGLVIGPIASAVVQSVLHRLGIPDRYLVRGVFLGSAAFALFVLAVSSYAENVGGSKETQPTPAENEAESNGISNSPKDATPKYKPTTTTPDYVQPLLRIVALAAGWSLTLTIAIYSLFASKFLGYAQPQLSSTYSVGAATVIATQVLLVPPLVGRAGEHLACALGLGLLATGLVGTSLCRAPLVAHAGFYMLIRVAQGITDTATATLVAKASDSPENRAKNLGMIQSTRAGARIFTPLASGALFASSARRFIGTRFAGALPYLCNAALALALLPLPLLLRRQSAPSPSKKGG